MLYLVFLAIISVGSVTPRATKVDFIHIEPERAVILFNLFKNCADQLGVDSKLMQNVIEWNFGKIESEKKFIYCFVNTSGYGDDDGQLNRNKFVQLIGNHKSKDKFVNVIDECNKLTGPNKYETSYKIVNCFKNTSPILFKL